MYDKLLRVLAVTVEVLLVICAAYIVGMVTTEVILRKFFQTSLIFTEEMARYLMVWIVFLGSVLAVRDGGHIRINFVIKRLGRRMQTLFALVAYLLTAGFLVILAIQTIKILPQQHWQFCITMDTSMYPFYLAIPVGCGLMLLYLIARIRDVLRGQLPDDPALDVERQAKRC